MNTKVLIEIRGGNIVQVSANTDLAMVVIDYDNVAAGDDPVVIPCIDIIHYNLWELFDNSTPVSQEIREELKRLKF